MSDDIIGAKVQFNILKKSYSMGRIKERITPHRGEIRSVRDNMVVIAVGKSSLHNRPINEITILKAGGG